MTAYEILGINENAGPEIIKAAYRKLAKCYHPDKNKDPDAAGKFIYITNAYHYLIDPDNKDLISSLFNMDEGEPTEFTHSYGFNTTYQQEKERQERARAYSKMRYDDFVNEADAFKKAWYFYPVMTVHFTLIILCALMFMVCIAGPAVLAIMWGTGWILFIYPVPIMICGFMYNYLIDYRKYLKPYLSNKINMQDAIWQDAHYSTMFQRWNGTF